MVIFLKTGDLVGEKLSMVKLASRMMIKHCKSLGNTCDTYKTGCTFTLTCERIECVLVESLRLGKKL